MSHEEITFTRDCDAIQIPQGTPIRISQGTQAVITQALGDTYTLQLPSTGALVRIVKANADAIGKTPTSQTSPSLAEESSGPVTEDVVWEQLKQVYDPEIPVNVVDLGLIYDLRLEPLPDGQSRVLVQMTLTAQGCGMGPAIAQDAQLRIEMLPGVAEAEVSVVWDPPWHPEMISTEGKKRLGMPD